MKISSFLESKIGEINSNSLRELEKMDASSTAVFSIAGK
jgi:hypothetical protein